MNRVRLGFIGIGPIAALHATAFSDLDKVELSVCASRTLDKATAFAARHGFATAMTIDALLEYPDVDALIIVVPAIHMASVAIRAATTRLPLLMEKPVGMSLAETERAAAAIPTLNMVGLNRRFYKVVREAERIIKEAGGARFIEVHMPEDIKPLAGRYDAETLAGWHFGNSVHLVDLFRFFGGEPRHVAAYNTVKSWFDRSYCGVISFDSDARGIFNAQWYAPGPWRVTVYADDVSIVLAPIEEGLLVRNPGRLKTALAADSADKRFKPGFREQAAAFVHLVRTSTLPAGAADLTDYVKSVRLLDTLTKASGLLPETGAPLEA